MDRTCWSSTSHRCWIGLRSGEPGGRVNTLNWLLCSSNVPEALLLCGREHYPAGRGHCHQGIPFPWKGGHGLEQCLGSCYLQDERFGCLKVPDRFALQRRSLLLYNLLFLCYQVQSGFLKPPKCCAFFSHLKRLNKIRYNKLALLRCTSSLTSRHGGRSRLMM